MSTWVIGDIQGCYHALQRLLDKIEFDPASDTLWLAGDLINRGPQSLEVLRFARELGDRCVSVLGNHDLHTLAVAKTSARPKKPDTMDALLAAPDCDELMDWLRHQPLAVYDQQLDFLMVHAGVYPGWDLATTLRLAAEAEAVLRQDNYVDFLEQMYGNSPDQWQESLQGTDRVRFIINSFTRMRFLYPDGRMDFSCKGPPGSQLDELQPWFAFPQRKQLGTRLAFGHWSTLPGTEQDAIYPLDTGCLWGGKLTALKIDNHPPSMTSIPCEQSRRPDE